MKIVRGEEGYAGGETVLLGLVLSAMLLAAATVAARLLGLGVLGTVAVAVGVVVVVVVVAAAAEALQHRRRRRLVDATNVAALADALGAEPVEGEAQGHRAAGDDGRHRRPGPHPVERYGHGPGRGTSVSPV